MRRMCRIIHILRFILSYCVLEVDNLIVVFSEMLVETLARNRTQCLGLMNLTYDTP